MKKILKNILTVAMIGVVLWGVVSFIEVNQKNTNLQGAEEISEWNLIRIMMESVEE